MRLLNVIMLVDVYVVAPDDSDVSLEAARKAVAELVTAGELQPSKIAANPVAIAPIREAWRNERPIVADNVSDADFARVKGKTTQEVYDMLFKKEGR